MKSFGEEKRREARSANPGDTPKPYTVGGWSYKKATT
jgi:hypothetical protein